MLHRVWAISEAAGGPRVWGHQFPQGWVISEASWVALVKNLTASARDVGDVDWIPGSGRSPGEGPGKSCGQRSLVGYSP